MNNENVCPYKYTHINDHSRNNTSVQEVNNMVYPYSDILFSNKKEWTTNAYDNINEPQTHYAKWKKKSQTQKTMHWMISFMWNFQKRQIHRERQQTSACLGATAETSRKYATLGDNRKVLNMGYVDGCTGL